MLLFHFDITLIIKDLLTRPLPVDNFWRTLLQSSKIGMYLRILTSWWQFYKDTS